MPNSPWKFIIFLPISIALCSYDSCYLFHFGNITFGSLVFALDCEVLEGRCYDFFGFVALPVCGM